MTTATVDATLTIEDVDEIWVSPSAKDPGGVPMLFRSAISLLGGVVWFDVRDADVLPIVRIAEWDVARMWFQPTFGDAAADAMDKAVEAHATDRALAFIGEAVEPFAPQSVELALGEDVTRLHRLATGLWLARYWPSDPEQPALDRSLLAAEVATIAESVDEVLSSAQFAPVMFGDLTEWLLRGGGWEGESLRQRVGRAAVYAAQRCLPDDEPHIDAIDQLALSLWEREQGQVAAESLSPAADLARLDQAAQVIELPRRRDILPPQLSLVAGGSDAVLSRGSVDWTRVRPEVLDVLKRPAYLQLSRIGPEVEVTVTAPGRPEALVDGDGVSCRVFGLSDAGSMFSLALWPMVADEDCFEAHGSVVAPEEWEIVVDVVLDSSAVTDDPYDPEVLTEMVQEAERLLAGRRAAAMGLVHGPGGDEAVLDGSVPFAAEVESAGTA